jgi:hypothetical protein
VGTVDVELAARKPGFKLVKRSPSEPLRITDDPRQPELADGVRYIRPYQPVNFELIFESE